MDLPQTKILESTCSVEYPKLNPFLGSSSQLVVTWDYLGSVLGTQTYLVVTHVDICELFN